MALHLRHSITGESTGSASWRCREPYLSLKGTCCSTHCSTSSGRVSKLGAFVFMMFLTVSRDCLASSVSWACVETRDAKHPSSTHARTHQHTHIWTMNESAHGVKSRSASYLIFARLALCRGRSRAAAYLSKTSAQPIRCEHLSNAVDAHSQVTFRKPDLHTAPSSRRTYIRFLAGLTTLQESV